MDPSWFHLITTAVLLSCVLVACDFSDGAPQIEIFPLEQTVADGSTVVFVCKVTGSPNRRIKWRRNGRKIHYHSRNESLNGSPRAREDYIPKFEKIDFINGSVLKINTAAPGTFECVVGNGAEELARATAQLKIIDCPPKIEIFPQNQTVVRGDIAVFVCTVTSSNNLQIKWLRNDRKINYSPQYESLYGSQHDPNEYIPKYEKIDMINGSVLRINSAEPGTFECVVGKVSEEPVRATAHLKTVYENSKPHGFPHIARRLTEYQWVTKGHHTLLPCLVTGDPKPIIRWLRNKIPLNMAIPRYSLFQEQYLQISDVKEEDKGKYECIAENSVGSAVSTKLGLYVSDKQYAPYFTIKPEELYALLPGSSLNITCLVNGSPMPSVKWRKDSTDISPNREGLNVLELTDIQGSHNYTCVASSETGTAEATAQVVAQLYPMAPTNLRASDVNATCAYLSWSYGTGSENLSYFSIAYKANNEEDYSVIYDLGEPIRPFFTLCDLDPDTEYEFFVTAYNGVGEGPRSSSVFATTKRQ